MIQGEAVRLHKNTICSLRPEESASFDGSKACTVSAFNSAKQMWLVRSEGRKKETAVAESRLRLKFSLLPTSAKLGCYHKVVQADQGACGRGLVAGQDIPKAGLPIFQEAPLLVVREITLRSDGAAPVNSFEHHLERWCAYSALIDRASRDGKEGVWVRARRAFEDLCVADHVPDHLREAAELIASKEEVATERVQQALMRFQSNQFTFRNGSEPNDESFSASAVYAFTSLVNHSCVIRDTPLVVLRCRESSMTRPHSHASLCASLFASLAHAQVRSQHGNMPQGCIQRCAQASVRRRERGRYDHLHCIASHQAG